MKQSTSDKNTGIEEKGGETSMDLKSGAGNTTNDNAGGADKASDTKNVNSSMSSMSTSSKESSQSSQATKKQEEKGKAPLEKFFTDMLKDIYYAEQQLTKALTKMESAATTEQLKEAFSDHNYQTQKHIKRLEKVFGMIGKKPEGKKCEAIEGLIKETESIISDTPEGSMTRDAALIIAAQKVEHYEIATYGGLVQLAMTMDLDEVSELLDQTLMEEEDTDQLLTDIAEGEINMEAEHEGANYSWAQEEGEGEDESVNLDVLSTR